MISLEQAVGILLIAYTAGGILSYFVYNRQINAKINAILGEPVVKSAMSIIGKKGGQVRHENAVLDQVANQILSSPKIGLLKTAAKQIGFDVDEMIEENGPAGTIEQILAAGEMLGIDVMGLLSGELNSGSQPITSGDNPYLK